MEQDTIKIGQYLIIQKHNYKKLHKFNKVSCITIGKDSIDLTGIEGCKYFSVFKMVCKSNKKNRIFSLELTNTTTDLKQELAIKSSGADNRNILDDGQSQKLTAAEIEDLKSESNCASQIVDTLISNSNTFHHKTEYSQEKYIKKKEKKYFEYLQIRKPNIRLIAEIMYKLEPHKIQNFRFDTLSQIVSYANIYSEGNHLLYDSGSNGLVAATLLSMIGPQTKGNLVHMHPGNMSQKQALLAMNFTQEQNDRCISVNVYSALRQFYQGNDQNVKLINSVNDDIVNGDKSLKREADTIPEVEHVNKVPRLNESIDASVDDIEKCIENEEKVQEPKRPKWHFDNIAAAEILMEKMDSLVIACKEDPLNIFNELKCFVKPGRPFVVYYNIAEPLQHMYLALKSQSNVAALKLTCNWMRNYQVLPERTHPDVTMNASSGFLLSGYILK